MRKIFLSWMILTTITLLGYPVLNAQEKTSSVESLKDVRTIYFNQLGSDVQDANFEESDCKKYVEYQRLINCHMSRSELLQERKNFLEFLETAFAARDFEIVSDFRNADAVMSMKVSVQKYCGMGGRIYGIWGGIQIPGIYVERIEAKLSNTDGKKLWSTPFFQSSGNSEKNNLNKKAEWLAEKVRKARDKTEKND